MIQRERCYLDQRTIRLVWHFCIWKAYLRTVILDLRMEPETSNEYKGGDLEMHQPPEKRRFLRKCAKIPLGRDLVKKMEGNGGKNKGPGTEAFNWMQHFRLQ